MGIDNGRFVPEKYARPHHGRIVIGQRECAILDSKHDAVKYACTSCSVSMFCFES